MQFQDVIEQRYSCRAFSPEPLTEEETAALVDAARVSPTGKNALSVRLYLIRSDQALAALDGASPCRYGAPLCIVFGYDSDAAVEIEREGDAVRSLGESDAAIAATHVMLKACDLGLGSCYVNRYFDTELRAAFPQIPESVVVNNLLMVGHAAEGSQPSERHFENLTRDRIAVFI